VEKVEGGEKSRQDCWDKREKQARPTAGCSYEVRERAGDGGSLENQSWSKGRATGLFWDIGRGENASWSRKVVGSPRRRQQQTEEKREGSPHYQERIDQTDEGENKGRIRPLTGQEEVLKRIPSILDGSYGQKRGGKSDRLSDIVL